jgi:hypothetical protein
MKKLTSVAVSALLAGASWVAAAQDLESVLAATAYKTDSTLVAEADQRFSRASEILQSGFAKGSPKEFRSEIERAALLGHPGAADTQCAFNSNEAFGIAFHRQGYFWCRVAVHYLSATDPENHLQRAKDNLAFVTKALGESNLHLGQEYEQFTLRKMLELAKSSDASVTEKPQ